MPISNWQAAAQEVEFPPLKDDLKVDVAIIGGGITGLLCARQMAAEGLEVAVLEAGRVGESSTGNSTGNLYALVGERHGKLDRDMAAAVCEARATGVDLIESLVDEHRLDCGFVRCPWVMYADDEADRSALEQARDLAVHAGLTVERSAPPLPFPVSASIAVEGQAQFDPLRFVKGLACALAQRGCAIHEQTRSYAVDAEDGRITTRAGYVKAGIIELATNTPNGRLLLHGELTVNREYGVAGPVRGDLLEPGIFWRAGEPQRSLRTYTYEGRPHLIVVGESHRTGADEDTRAHHEALAAFARERFGVTAQYRWSAQNYRAADGLPYIGRSALGDKVLVATGFAADGLTYGAVAARLLARLVAGRDDPLLERFDPRRKPSLGAAKELVTEGGHMLKALARDIPGTAHGTAEALLPGEARIVEHGGEKLAAHRDEAGRLHVVSAVCTHLQCLVRWNTAERSWDCPCHGSRFSPDGTVLEGPALADLPARPASAA